VVQSVWGGGPTGTLPPMRAVLRRSRRSIGRWRGRAGASAPTAATNPPLAYEPALVPSPDLMHTEGIEVLEEWFRWAEEWSVLLRVYGHVGARSRILEVGCGLGRIAFPLRYVLTDGSYEGFEVVRDKVAWLEATFTPAHPTFRFTWADLHNTHYNPGGATPAERYVFPYEAASFDVVFAASVFTHMLPGTTAAYLQQAARVLRPGGRCLFSFFLLDHYDPSRARPLGFASPAFAFDHHVPAAGDDFAVAVPDDPERMTAYRLALVERLAADAGLRLAEPPLPGLWSGAFDRWIGAQDVVVLEHAVDPPAGSTAPDGEGPVL
jgi:SAM-dependent methyltransferase